MNNFLNKYFSYFFLLLFAILLISPSIASAANVMGNLMDPIAVSLDAISEKVGPWATVIILAFLFFVLSGALLIIITNLLQGAIEGSIETLNILQGESAIVIHAGWNFMAGIVNMMLLIGFVVIAIAIIMGSDSYGLKKAMPKLILVAFLVNFTLLFVGIGVDITNIIYNTVANRFSEEGGSILIEAVSPLLTGLWPAGIAMFVGFFISWVAAAINPFTALVAHAVIAFGFLALIPFILQFIIVGAIMLLMAGVFFTFYAVFIARTLIISILAILSPLAFFCLIFPATKKWWDMWLHHFIQWLFVGIAFIFFMYIGLTLAPLAMRLGEDSITLHPFLKFWTGNLVSYIILLIYFVVILGIVKKFIPELASAAIAQAKSAAAVVAPYAQFTGGLVTRGYKNQYSSAVAQRMAADPNGFGAARQTALNTVPDPNANWWQKTQIAWRRRVAQVPEKYASDRLNDLEKGFEGKNEVEHQSTINNDEARRNPKKVLAAIRSARNKNMDVTEQINSLDNDNRNLVWAHSDLAGENRMMQRMDSLHYLTHINPGATPAEARENRRNLIARLSDDDINRLGRTLAAAVGDPVFGTTATDLLRDIAMSGRQNARNLVAGGGRNTIDEIINRGILTGDNLNRFFGFLIGHLAQWHLSDAERATGYANR